MRKTLLSVFVFKDESEAQRQPLNFPTHNGIILVDRFFFFLFFFRGVYAYYAREVLSKETKRLFHSPNSFDFFKTDATREREREKKRDEKKNTNRERSNRVRLPGPPLSISRHKYYKYYSLLSLTDKPAGAGDANLQLL